MNLPNVGLPSRNNMVHKNKKSEKRRISAFGTIVINNNNNNKNSVKNEDKMKKSDSIDQGMTFMDWNKIYE